MMSQEEVEKMLQETGQLDGEEGNTEIVQKDASSAFNVDDYLTKDERDVLGEIGNISMGTSATTMYTLLDKKVSITTPRVAIHNIDTLSKEYERPILVVEVNYTEGLEGKNLLILKEYDVALMTDVLMGGDGSEIDPNNIVLDEMHISAIREVMNQMVGSSATAMANLLGFPINISTPSASHMNLNNDNLEGVFEEDEKLVKISFKMEIEGLLTSEIMQVIPLDFAKQLVEKLMKIQKEQKEGPPVEIDENTDFLNPTVASAMSDLNAANGNQSAPAAPVAQAPASAPSAPAAATAPAVPQQQAASATPVYNENYGTVKPASEVSASQAEFPDFEQNVNLGIDSENISMLANVPMKVTVELGKNKKTVKEILEFNAGSVVVLDKLAGEPVDVLVNGRPVAKGEVVVVDDNYGVRITEINSRVIAEQ